jgi:hypothetical protein
MKHNIPAIMQSTTDFDRGYADGRLDGFEGLSMQLPTGASVYARRDYAEGYTFGYADGKRNRADTLAE